MHKIPQDKTALVTGGSRGIGYAIAKAYLQAGYHVVICGRSPEALRKAEESLLEWTLNGRKLLAIPCDVAAFSSVEKLINETLQYFNRIDCLVNNAAIGMTYGRVGEIDPRSWKHVIENNLIGTFHCCHVIIPHMLKAGGGKIINLTGYGARIPSPRLSAYGASKAGIAAFTRSLAREYKEKGIAVNLLSPGVVKTRLTLSQVATVEGEPFLEKGRAMINFLAEPPEAAAALALKISSKEMDGITGKTFRVMSRKKMLLRLIGFGLSKLFNRQPSSR